MKEKAEVAKLQPKVQAEVAKLLPKDQAEVAKEDFHLVAAVVKDSQLVAAAAEVTKAKEVAM